ncbi:hypothetical protein KSP40_PGU005805 [Platanthera guangdongensis]|uniref:Uncharacterized protein n=1 Tax=Platanthera guangdongensis TaxID=2320717 RepID=A0ABR2MDY2_9ASPA
MNKRSKALKLTAGFPGVLSAGLRGDTIIVVGEEIDSVALAIALRKKFGFVELVRVACVTEEDDLEERTEELGKCWNGQKIYHHMSPLHGYMTAQQPYITPQPHYVYDSPRSNYDSSCSIM